MKRTTKQIILAANKTRAELEEQLDTLRARGVLGCTDLLGAIAQLRYKLELLAHVVRQVSSDASPDPSSPDAT